MTTLVKRNYSPVENWPLFFDDFFADFPVRKRLFGAPGGVNSLPAVNIREDDNSFFIDVAAPGMKKSDFNIDLDNKSLVLSATTEEENEERENGYSRKEFCYGSFERRFSLPETVNAEKISAKYADGILNIVLPKVDAAKVKPAKRIKIG